MLKKYPKDRAEDIANIAWELDYHRHTGYDIILITQSPKLLNQHTLDFVGEHLHLRRIFGVKRSTIFHFPEHKLNPNTKSVRDEAINKEAFKFPKHLFKFYKSASQHTDKVKIPLKYIVILLFVFIGLPSVFYLKWKNDKILNIDNVVTKNVAHVLEKPQIKPQPISYMDKNEVNDSKQIELSRIAMIIESSVDCYAKNSYGDVIEMKLEECRYLSNKNNRIQFSKIKKEQYIQENISTYDSQNLDYKPPIYPNNKAL